MSTPEAVGHAGRHVARTRGRCASAARPSRRTRRCSGCPSPRGQRRRRVGHVQDRLVGREGEAVGLDRADRSPGRARRSRGSKRKTKQSPISDSPPWPSSGMMRPYGGSVNQIVPSDFTTMSLGALKRLPCQRSTTMRWPLPSAVGAEHRAQAMRAMQERAVVIARVAVGELDALAPHAHPVALPTSAASGRWGCRSTGRCRPRRSTPGPRSRSRRCTGARARGRPPRRGRVGCRGSRSEAREARAWRRF